MADPDLRPPRERACERCGRRDRWDGDVGRWAVVVEDGEPLAGDPFCIHERASPATTAPSRSEWRPDRPRGPRVR